MIDVGIIPNGVVATGGKLAEAELRVADDGATLDSVRDMILRAYALHVPALAEATA